MEQYALSNEEITILKKHAEEFQKWRETEAGIEKIKEHIEHASYFKLRLAPQNLPKITKPELIEIYKHLWASGFWENKDWKINNKSSGLVNVISF